MDKNINLTKSLKDLTEIATWFDQQETVDVEVGLEKVKLAAQIIKDSRTRLTEIENEFKEIQKEISTEDFVDFSYETQGSEKQPVVKLDQTIVDDEELVPSDIPF